MGREKSNRRWLLVVALVAVMLWGMRGSVRQRSSGETMLHDVVEIPLLLVESLVTRSSNWVAELFRRERLHAQIGELEAKLAELQLRNQLLDEAARENERLGRLLGLRQRANLEGRSARVIAGDALQGVRSLVIDLGADVGTVKDSPVVSADGLLGRIVKVGQRTSVVQLLVDGSAGVAVMVERSGVQGVVVGTGKDRLSLQFVPNIEDVAKGDRILASGLDGIYPKGAVVGTVDSVEPGGDAFQVIDVAPAVAPNRVGTVFVVSNAGVVSSEGFLAALEGSSSP